MSWISTLSGNKIDFLDPDPQTIEIEDIAAGLAAMPRWAGQTLWRGAPCHYSVAQHSWAVSMKFATPRLALMALLHDATEAYMGDCPRPLKDQLGSGAAVNPWKQIEHRLLVVIFARFGLNIDHELAPPIKHADDRMLITERRDLQPACPDWESGPWPDPYEERLQPWPYAMAYQQFLQRFHKLSARLKSQRLA